MKYYLQLMANKREDGLKRSIEVKAEDVPRSGDHVRVRDVYLKDFPACNTRGFIDAVVYECYRSIQKIDNEWVQDIPVVRALIK